MTTTARETPRVGFTEDAPPPLQRMGRRNVLAGVLGYGWTSVLQVIATPILLALLGAESFGLLGFYLATQAVVQVFDLGLSPTMNRELARAAANGSPDEMHDLLATVELGYWGLGAVLGLLVLAVAPALTSHWSAMSALSAPAIHRSIQLIALVVALQWPVTLYEGGLTGLQRMPTLHAAGIAMRTLATGLGLALVYFVHRDFSLYLAGFAAGSLCHALLLAYLLRRAMPRASRAPLRDPRAVYRVWRFAAGVSLLLLLSAVLTQTDRLVLSRLLSLRDYGYYALAALLASGLAILVLPIFYALFPVLSGRVAVGDVAGERDAYHLGSQTFSVFIVPAAAVIAFFAGDILSVWTGDPVAAAHASDLARLLVIGSAMSGVLAAPYALQLAHGQTRLGSAIHAGLIVLYVPAILIAAPRVGAIGAAWAWLGVNVVYLLLDVPLTHRLLLPGASAEWVLRDFLWPALPGVAVTAVCWYASRAITTSPLVHVLMALVALALAWAAAAGAAPRVRRWLAPGFAQGAPRLTSQPR